ncbi:PLP-dependent aminotransferase family protein [Deinococcus sp. QL22]|uniref:MocR-like pyridoxine biosynthesis transcription factor PdxR n=1 Tax=Deinococcus sp. QL22 TaxID=2939437 RepID=UPI0020179B06|nr:PLP-dependent aminotransferase family protein [Deinococcus sp. QL22]UQN08136.1 PLP-dependent aminotransferase family protein [Deinococcus sp. QL22]
MPDHLLSPRRAVPVDLPLHLDRDSAVPVAQQLEEQLRAAILSGQLLPGARLPSTRAVAREVGLSRGAAISAYEGLLAEGYLVGQVGAGTYVTPDLPPRGGTAPLRMPVSPLPRWLRTTPVAPEVSPAAVAGMIDFRLGQAAVAALSDEAWRRAWRRVAEEPLPGAYADPAGDPELRAQVAAYLRRSRGLVCGAQDVVITAGAIQGLHLVAQAVLGPGDTAAFEEPGYRLARQVLRERGVQILPVPVDADGMRVSALPLGVDAPPLVYLTPSHQFPLGSRLSIPRRHALLAWAREHDSLIVEDDYDGEFRYDTAPLPVLASLDPSRVAYLGTFSKVLSPALRVGYVVAPPLLREHLTAFKAIADYHTSWPVQRALAFFLGAGDLDRHLRRMRRVYARKREVLVRELSAAGALAQVGGLEAGFHVHLDLDPRLDAEAVVRLAAARGVQVGSLAPFYVSDGPYHGLLLGYGGLELAQIVQGARVLVEVMHTLADPAAS